jgi:hypothetical protein
MALPVGVDLLEDCLDELPLSSKRLKRARE